jgi:hypothetical protein
MCRWKKMIMVCIMGILLGVHIMASAAPLGTVFTYQGRLTDGGNPANGAYDFVFELYDVSSEGSPLGTQTKNGIAVNDGYFTVELDFGSSAFTGDARWLQIDVKPTSSGTYSMLSPRQELTPTPYAIYAAGTDWANLGNIPPGFADGVDNVGSGDSDWTISGMNMYSGVSGNVGIGTSSPSFDLDIFGSEGFRVVESAGADSSFIFGEFGETTWDYAGIEFARVDQDPGPAGYLQLSHIGVPKVQLHSQGNSYFTGGNVGIGTSNPSRELDVDGTVKATHFEGDGTQLTGVPSKHTGAVYRWMVFDTYLNNLGWINNNDPTMFGGIHPSTWTDGNGIAGNLSSDKEVLRTLFTRKGYAGKNANVVSEVYIQYSSTNGKVALVLFRIKNNTPNAITWTPNFHYTCYSGWSERASVALNGVTTWNSGATNAGVNNFTNIALSIPPERTSTIIFVSTSSSTTGSIGSNLTVRGLILAFGNNSLELPAGLEYVDDLDTASGGWEQ